MVLGFVVAAKACENDNLNNCTAHILMGSSFLGFGVFGMLAPFLVSLSYFKSWSREWYESLVIMIWGIINTLTLGLNWTIRDRQHVSMGVLFWVGGSLGLMFEWRFIRNSFITRGVNPLPGLVLAYTGKNIQVNHSD